WSAHAFATAASGVVLPDAVAHPPFSINSVCLHEAVFWNSVSFAMASGCFMKLSTQIGVKRATTAAFARSVAICSAVLLRVQPHQAKPIIIIATAPMTTPHTPGLIHCGTCMSYSLGTSFLQNVSTLVKESTTRIWRRLSHLCEKC